MCQWAWSNSMHEFRLPPSCMWYVFGCESEASDLTPDKSSLCCSIRMYYWANSRGQIHFYLSAIDVTPTSHKSASAEAPDVRFFLFLCTCRNLCVCMRLSMCPCVSVCACVSEAKGESISRRCLQGGIGLTNALSCLLRYNPVMWQRTRAHWSCFDSGFWHSLTLISCLYR